MRRAGQLIAWILVAPTLVVAPQAAPAEEQVVKDGYEALVGLFREWRD